MKEGRQGKLKVLAIFLAVSAILFTAVAAILGARINDSPEAVGAFVGALLVPEMYAMIVASTITSLFSTHFNTSRRWVFLTASYIGLTLLFSAIFNASIKTEPEENYVVGSASVMIRDGINFEVVSYAFSEKKASDDIRDFYRGMISEGCDTCSLSDISLASWKHVDEELRRVLHKHQIDNYVVAPNEGRMRVVLSKMTHEDAQLFCSEFAKAIEGTCLSPKGM